MVLMLILMFCVVGYWFVDDAIVLCCSRRLRLSLQAKGSDCLRNLVRASHPRWIDTLAQTLTELLFDWQAGTKYVNTQTMVL